MQLVALVNNVDHVCCRYRLKAFRDWLDLAGHSLEFEVLPRSWPQRWLLFRRLRGANLLLQRTLLPSWQVSLLRSHVSRLLFDFDDAIFLRDSYSEKGLHDSRRLRRFVATVSVCDAVIAGNSFLAEHAAMYARPERIHVIPTCVDETRYPQQSDQADDGKELVWIGSSSTLQGLERIAPTLGLLAEAVPGLRLKIICDRFPTLHRLPVLPVRWSEKSEATELAASSVGISWVPDDLWSRGKCGLKLLQYAAARLPVIANPVGVHSEIVTSGENGYLAASTQEWIEAVRLLTGDPRLRRRMGHSGRQRLEACYSVSRGAKLWCQLLDRMEKAPIMEGGSRR